jgi:hypothetical protein
VKIHFGFTIGGPEDTYRDMPAVPREGDYVSFDEGNTDHPVVMVTWNVSDTEPVAFILLRS